MTAKALEQLHPENMIKYLKNQFYKYFQGKYL